MAKGLMKRHSSVMSDLTMLKDGNVPLFDYPPVQYKDCEGWKLFQRAISSPFREDMDDLLAHTIQAKKYIQSRSKAMIMQNLEDIAHKFPFYYVKMRPDEIEVLKTEDSYLKLQ